jgi:hypothetical protein
MADGRIAYQGPASDGAEYFRTLGYKCSKLANPADVFMRVLAVNYPINDEEKAKLALFDNEYAKTLAPQVRKDMAQFECPSIKVRSASDIEAPLSIQFAQLWKRTVIMVKREPAVCFAQLG